MNPAVNIRGVSHEIDEETRLLIVKLKTMLEIVRDQLEDVPEAFDVIDRLKIHIGARMSHWPKKTWEDL